MNSTITSRQNISESTGFDHGAEFESEAQVRDYFTVESMTAMGLGGKAAVEGSPTGEYVMYTQDELDGMADAVIANRWHCAF